MVAWGRAEAQPLDTTAASGLAARAGWVTGGAGGGAVGGGWTPE